MTIGVRRRFVASLIAFAAFTIALASPFCRTAETAKLIFGRATVSNPVRGWPIAQAPADRYAGLRDLLSTPLPPGTNTAIVSHGSPFRALTAAPYLAEGEAAVIEPRGREGFRIVARVTKEGWGAL